MFMAQDVTEHCRDLIEGDSVILEVRNGLLRIPFENLYATSQSYRRLDRSENSWHNASVFTRRPQHPARRRRLQAGLG